VVRAFVGVFGAFGCVLSAMRRLCLLPAGDIFKGTLIEKKCNKES
jgi:hypothetical protein